MNFYRSLALLVIVTVTIGFGGVAEVLAAPFYSGLKLDAVNSFGEAMHYFKLNGNGEVLGRSIYQQQARYYVTEKDGTALAPVLQGNGYRWVSIGDMNDQGMIVGTVADRLGKQYIAVSGPEGKGVTVLATSLSFFIAGINNQGQVLVTPFSPGERGYIYNQDGTETELGSVGIGHPWALALNDKGQIAGLFDTEDEGSRGFIARIGGAGMIDLGYVEPSRLNDRGQVTGVLYDMASGMLHDFFTRTDGTIVDVDNWGGLISGINNKGIVTGTFDCTGRAGKCAFIMRDGDLAPIDLTALVDFLTGDEYLVEVLDINDLGQMLVRSSSGNFYLLSGIVQEPPFSLLLLIGLFGLSLRRSLSVK